MANRHFGLTHYWNQKAKEWTPLLSFRGQTREEWRQWRTEAERKLFELLGDFPAPVELAAEVEYAVREDDLIRERVVFDSEEYASVPCYVLRPADMRPDRTHPAIICCNGHPVDLGKDPVAGMRSGPEYEEQIRAMNYDYGYQLAKAGFLTIIPELRGFGERNDAHRRADVCDINYVKGSILGLYPLTLNIWDVRRCIDYLETRAEVDPNRIGMAGLSYGGTMTAFTAAVDSRIKAADVMGYVNPFKEFGLARGNFCGSQVVPGLYKYFDTHDIAGLIAPRPLLLEMGIYDECFYFQDLMKGYEGVRRIYDAAGVPDLLETDVFPGPHRFGGNKAFDFFRKHL